MGIASKVVFKVPGQDEIRWEDGRMEHGPRVLQCLHVRELRVPTDEVRGDQGRVGSNR